MKCASDKVSSNQADTQPDSSQDHCLFKHQADHLCSTCTESHSQANLVLALRNSESHHTVNAHRRQQQRNRRETEEQRHNKSVAGKIEVLDLLQRAWLRKRDLRINGVN